MKIWPLLSETRARDCFLSYGQVKGILIEINHKSRQTPTNKIVIEAGSEDSDKSAIQVLINQKLFCFAEL